MSKFKYKYYEYLSGAIPQARKIINQRLAKSVSERLLSILKNAFSEAVCRVPAAEARWSCCFLSASWRIRGENQGIFSQNTCVNYYKHEL